MSKLPNWAEELRLRDEVVASDGSVGELQMSLGKVVYQTADVPYREADYWCDITEPTDSMINVFASVARRLWSPAGKDSTALFQFDQGMGGGKSHTLVGMWHMARSPEVFFAADVGSRVKDTAEVGGRSLDVQDVQVVALCADQFSPGKTSPLFGPAETLFERFLWSLFADDRATYDRLQAQGADKATITEAFRLVGKPVMVLVDELMDYVAAAAGNDYVDRLQSEEHQFLNSLFDACDDVDNVVVLLVMIRSDLDPLGYNRSAQEFREFLQSRINRNGTSTPVTESKDFLNIIRRRLFDEPPTAKLVQQAVAAIDSEIDDTWRERVFDRLPGGRNVTTLTDRLGQSYPFHPDLVSLVQDEWSTTVGFQRVRSTVRIFAATLLHWFGQHEQGAWVPPLIGIGDVPLDGRGVLDSILNSGLLLGNDTAVQGFANLASTDVTSLSGESGRAVELDRVLTEAEVDARQPSPAVRMASALFTLSLVNRAQGARGAVKQELHAAVWVPGLPFATAEEVFVHIVDQEQGLGSLETDQPDNNRNRYWLSIKRTLNALHKAAKSQIQAADVSATAWDQAKVLAKRHQSSFDAIVPLDDPGAEVPLANLIGQIDTQSTRLVVLDPSRWTLLNGRDSTTREEVQTLLGGGDHTVPHAASCVIATVNTQQRRYMEDAARDVLAWRHVSRQLADSEEETTKQIKAHLTEAEDRLRQRILTAFRHYAYVAPSTTPGEAATVEYRRFEEDGESSLRGDHVWQRLVNDGRAAQPGQLAPKTLEMLFQTFNRPLTPQEVVQAFYGDPRFPLVADTSDISHAWDGLLGVGIASSGGWTLIDADGNVRHVAGPGEVALNRKDVTFQPMPETEEETTGTDRGDGSTTESGDRPGSSGAPGSGGTPTSTGAPGTGATGFSTGGTSSTPAAPLREYTLHLPNLSLGDAQKQREVWAILTTLADRLDVSSRGTTDPQVIDIKVNVTMRETDFTRIYDALHTIGKGTLTDEEPLA